MQEKTGLPENVQRALRFAKRGLGPLSFQLVSQAGVQALVQSHVRAGVAIEDAVLIEVKRNARGDCGLANEFLAYFLADLYRLGRPMISPGLHRFLDTGDLAQSVLGDLWPSLDSLEFRSRGEFLSLLAKRLRWKSSDGARRAGRGGGPLEELDARDNGGDVECEEPSPLTHVADRDEHERLILSLLRLRERDRRLVTAYLQGEPLEKLMDELGMGYEAVRKAQRRAILRARDLLRREED